MRIESRVFSISWIPTESVRGALRKGFDLKFAHYDLPPPDRIEEVQELRRLRDEDAFRFSNLLSVWIDVEDGKVVDSGFADESGLIMGSTQVRVAGVGARFRAISLPALQQEPIVDDSSVRFAQTVGGRTGAPLPRPVRHAPFVQWQAPVVWTTLALTLSTDGSTTVEMPGASAFPRHWVYDDGGALSLKSGLTDQQTWVGSSFGERTPWGDQDSPALVTAAETQYERQLSEEFLKPGVDAEIRHVPKGAEVTRQGEPGSEIFLLLDGILGVDVDGERVGDVGPGAILGERAILEGGLRRSTLTALTPARLAVAGADLIDRRRLAVVAEQHGAPVNRE
jgi:Cyclic nucleotide-binding domain